MARIEDEWHAKFHDMTEVPFSDALRQRILNQIQGNTDNQQSTSSTPHGARKRMKRALWQPWLAAASGLCMLVALVWGVLSWNDAAPGHMQQQSFSAATRETASTTGSTRRNVPFGLVNAPVSMSNIGIGSEPGYANDSFVIANLTNLGTATLHEGQVFGVLWFSKSSQQNSLATSDWATFVDFQMSNGSKSLEPGDSGVWSFRPVGAPSTDTGKLTETPHLAFYRAGLASGSVADTVWPQTQLSVDTVKVTQRYHGTGWQSFQVTAQLHNPTRKSVSLGQTRAVVWFSTHPMTDWTQPDVVRFLASPTPDGGSNTILPGATESVYFRLIGSDTTDFLGMIPHVAMIQRR